MTIKKKGKHSKKRKKNWTSKIFKILRKALVMKSFDLNKFLELQLHYKPTPIKMVPCALFEIKQRSYSEFEILNRIETRIQYCFKL